MPLKFEEIRFDGIGRKAGRADLMWSNLHLGFKDSETDHHPSIEMTLLLSKSPAATIAELEKQARDRAKSILSEALALLEEHDVASLFHIEAEMDRAEQERLGMP